MDMLPVVGRIEFGTTPILTADAASQSARIAELEKRVASLTAGLIAIMEAHTKLVRTLALVTAQQTDGSKPS